QVQAALRAFELVLLREIGLLPDLSVVTATQRAVRAGELFVLRPEAGVALAGSGEPGLPGGVLIGAQAALEHGSMAALRQVCASALPAFKTALRALLHYHLGTPTMRTRQVMLELQSL
ncbi:MAG: DNA repair protein RecO C-terminal domain-containing protein, partial [Burkholderiaceae bacterium]|nr:DNA repair protein RecO C-terminal domain-containing protein [Burkholderiaceae bacterium]